MIRAEKIVGKDGLDWIKVTFRYHDEVVKSMGKVKGALYSSKAKAWAVPYANKDDFESKMGDFLISWVGDEGKDVTNGGISEDIISEEPIVPGYGVTYNEEGDIVDSKGFKTRPWGEFQVKGFNCLVARDFLILADDAGLGKSWQVANAIEAKKKLGHVKRGIVLAKASLLFNWRDEIHTHTNQKAIVLAGSQKQRHKLYSQLINNDDWTYIIISYETFRGDINNVQWLDNHKQLDFCVMDEAHKVKNSQSKIGTVIHKLPFKVRYILTATPLPNSPLESFNYLKFGKKTDKNWWNFRNRYGIMGGFGGKEIIGYKNITELREVIQGNMLRRRKTDKLKELPDVTFKTINLQMTPRQARKYRAVKNEIIEDLKDTDLQTVPNALAKLQRLQQVTDSISLIGADPHKDNSVKIQALDEMLKELIDEGNEKVIIFSRFKAFTKILVERYKNKYNPAVINGDVDSNGISKESAIRRLRKLHGEEWIKFSQDKREELIEDVMTSDRQKEVYKFQQDETCKLFIGTAPACREGLTLTKATHVIFMDTEWSPAYVEQAYSRAHRIGQKNAVTVYYLICEGTIDEKVQETLKNKENMAQMMIDQGVESVGATRAREFIASMVGEELVA